MIRLRLTKVAAGAWMQAFRAHGAARPASLWNGGGGARTRTTKAGDGQRLTRSASKASPC
jgi:hypothetical protein